MKIEEILKSRFHSEDQKGPVNLMYTANWIILQVEALLKPYNLTNEQYNVLRILRGSHPEGLCLKQVTERMINPNCNTTRVVNRLVLKKLITKKQSGTDKRELSINISAKGLEMLKSIDSVFETTPPRTGLIIHEWYLLNELLDKLRDVDGTFKDKN